MREKRDPVLICSPVAGEVFFFGGFDFDIEFLPSQTLWTYFIFVTDGGHFKRMGLKEEQCTVRH